MQAKQAVRELLDRLPDDCSVEDILYHLYVLHEVEAGRSDVEAGRVVSHDQVVREMRRKWVLGAAGQRRAYDALDEAVAYIAADSPSAAERLLPRLLDAGSSLAELAERGRVVSELSDPSIRELVVPPYRLIYEHDEERVWILTLLHEKREFELRRDDLREP